MPENIQDNNIEQGEQPPIFRPEETVCINASRIYDSCADKDCAEDLPVFFPHPIQQKIDNASSVRFCSADVITVYINLEPVPFHRGFYTVEMTFFFEVTLELCSAPSMRPDKVCGLSIFTKKAVLYGSEGSVKVFSSDADCDCGAFAAPQCTLPKATVQTAAPIPLSAQLVKCPPMCIPCCQIPEAVSSRFGGGMVTGDRGNTVLVTIGLFTIVQIERRVQMLMPAYDFCVPEKECPTTSSSPCELFGKLDFPTEEFFPPDVSSACDDCGGKGK